MTHQEYKQLADRAAELAVTCTVPSVSEALLALASNYTSMADRLGRRSREKETDLEDVLLTGFGD
jgi:hypothetical protein